MTQIKHETQKTASSHTPGPWHVHDKKQRNNRYDVWPERGLSPVAVVCNWPNEGTAHVAQSEANAHLIAASPKLLQSLIRVVAWAEPESGNFTAEEIEWLADARTAIAEAKGLAA